MRSYRGISSLATFQERFDYLKIGGEVGLSTFGFSRYLNQLFYHSDEWRKVRNEVLARDEGCDLGIPDRMIFYKPIVHHMNPVTEEQIQNRDPIIFDPNFLITVSPETHNAIHYGGGCLSDLGSERSPGDTKLW